MLTINRQTEYAIFLLHFLQCRKKSVSLREIVSLTGLSASLLSKVASKLVEADILISKEGLGGGYQLKKKLAKISLGMVIGLFEKKKRIVSCFSDHKNCISDCQLKNFWRKVEEDIENRICPKKPMDSKQIVLDVETKKLFSEIETHNPADLEISYAGILPVSDDGSFNPKAYQGFFEADLPKLWPILERASRLIGFNLVGFDLPALSAYYSGDFSHFSTLDILEEIKKITGHRVSLHAVAQTSLKETKIGSGVSAVKLWNEQRLNELAEYCRQDVIVTAKVFEYGVKNKYLLFRNKWNEDKRVEIDFSLKVTDPKVQMTLGIS